MTEEQNVSQNQDTGQEKTCRVTNADGKITKKGGEESDRTAVREKLTAYINGQEQLVLEIYATSWQRDLETIQKTAIEMKDDLLKDKKAIEANFKQIDKFLPKLKKTIEKQLKKYRRANFSQDYGDHLAIQKSLNLDFYEGPANSTITGLYEATKKLERGLVDDKANIENAYEQLRQAELAVQETKELWYERFLEKKEKYLKTLDEKRESFLGKPVSDTFKSVEAKLDPAFLRTKRVKDFLVSNQNSPIRQMCFELYDLEEKEEVIKAFVKKAKELHEKILLVREEDVSIIRRKFTRALGKVIKLARKTQLKF